MLTRRVDAGGTASAYCQVAAVGRGGNVPLKATLTVKEQGFCTRTSQKLSHEVNRPVPMTTVTMIFDRLNLCSLPRGDGQSIWHEHSSAPWAASTQVREGPPGGSEARLTIGSCSVESRNPGILPQTGHARAGREDSAVVGQFES